MVKLLDFWASWCGPCRIMNPVLEEVEKEFADRLEVVKINVDDDSGAAGKFGVLSIPTYVIEKDGREVARLIGARTSESFKAWLSSYVGD